MFGGFAAPADRLGAVPRHSFALVIHQGEAVLTSGVTLVGGFAVPADSFGVILRHSLTLGITLAEAELSSRVPLAGAHAVYPRVLSELPLKRFFFAHRPKDYCPTHYSYTCYRCCNFPK